MPSFAAKLGSLFLDDSGKFSKRSIKEEGVKVFETEDAALAAGVSAGYNEKHIAVFQVKTGKPTFSTKPVADV